MLNAYPRALTEGLSLSSRDLADETWFDLVDPTEAEVRMALSGVLCRCTGYTSIVQAVLDAGRVMREKP